MNFGMIILEILVWLSEEVNKIALNSNDNKRLQIFDRITTYPDGTNASKVCESETLSKICV